MGTVDGKCTEEGSRGDGGVRNGGGLRPSPLFLPLFNEKGRVMDIQVEPTRYVIDGRPYDRLTYVLGGTSSWVEKWRAEVGEEEAERVMKEASEFGTRVHYGCELWNRGLIVECFEYVEKVTEAEMRCIEAYCEWMDEYVEEVWGVEVTVWSDVWGVAGTADLVARLKGDKKLSIVDIKTGSLGENVGLQGTGYMELWNEMREPKVERIVAISVPRKEPGRRVFKEYHHHHHIKRFGEIVREYQEKKMEG